MIEYLDELTLIGAVEIIGVDAKMKVFLIENAPNPLFESALTLYYTSSVPVNKLWVNIRVLISVVPTWVHDVSS